MKKIMTLIHGFCMALADSVPGVSGGTVAFLMGFYDDFINSLNNLISGSKEERKQAFFYLVNLGIGWIVSFVLAILILASLFETHIYSVSSLFMGFILFAIPVVIMEEKQCLKEKWKLFFFAIIGAAIVILIAVLNPVGGENSIDLSNPNILTYLYIFMAGAVAICAMVLPGISGSTLLLIFGLYLPIISGIKDFLHLDFHAFPILVAFGLGVITGIISTIKLIRTALERFRGGTIYFIIGLMIGSIYSIITGPATLDVPQPAMTFETFNVLFFLIGGVVIVGMQFMKKFAEKKQQQ